VKLITHFPLVPRSRMCGAIPPLPNTPLWRGAQLKKESMGTTLPSSHTHTENRRFKTLPTPHIKI